MRKHVYIYIHKKCVNTYVIGVYIYTCGGGGGGGGARARAPCTPRFWGVVSAAMAAIPLTGLDWCSPFVTTVNEARAGCGCVSGRNSQTSAQKLSNISPDNLTHQPATIWTIYESTIGLAFENFYLIRSVLLGIIA